MQRPTSCFAPPPIQGTKPIHGVSWTHKNKRSPFYYYDDEVRSLLRRVFPSPSWQEQSNAPSRQVGGRRNYSQNQRVTSESFYFVSYVPDAKEEEDLSFSTWRISKYIKWRKTADDFLKYSQSMWGCAMLPLKKSKTSNLKEEFLVILQIRPKKCVGSSKWYRSCYVLNIISKSIHD